MTDAPIHRRSSRPIVPSRRIREQQVAILEQATPIRPRVIVVDVPSPSTPVTSVSSPPPPVPFASELSHLLASDINAQLSLEAFQSRFPHLSKVKTMEEVPNTEADLWARPMANLFSKIDSAIQRIQSCNNDPQMLQSLQDEFVDLFARLLCAPAAILGDRDRLHLLVRIRHLHTITCPVLHRILHLR